MLKKLSFLFLLFPCLVEAQAIDSTQVGYVTLANSDLNKLDTTLSLDSYLNFNDFLQDDFGKISMGSQGDVRRSLFFSPKQSLQPNLGIEGYFGNAKLIEEIRFYNVKVPTGGVQFLSGYNKGQMFNGYFTINPISRLNVFIDYQRINSRGNYLNQQNKSDRLQLSTRFSSKKDVYRVSGAFSFNNFNNLEFGGIANSSDFENNIFSNRELIAVNLLGSSSHARATETFLKQSLRLYKLDSISDLRMVYAFSSSNQFVAFASTDSVFTENALFESYQIRDSIRTNRLENFAGLALEKGSTLVEGGVQYSYFTHRNDYLDLAENLFGLKFKATGDVARLKYTAFFENFFTGSFKSNYDVGLGISYRTVNRNWNFGARVKQGLYNPGQFQQKFVSNNFIWTNDFSAIGFSQAIGEVNYKNYGISVTYGDLKNHVYFNQLATPAQYKASLKSFSVDLNARLKLTKGFFLDNRVRYQTINNTEIVRIPEWVLRSILYYEFGAFKNALTMHFGTEFQYFSSFASEAYMPATTIMYLQDDVEIGNFPYFNFFLNFKIQEFVFFVRLENITEGLFKYNYFAAPAYPLPDFAFRFGAKWRFFN